MSVDAEALREAMLMGLDCPGVIELAESSADQDVETEIDILELVEQNQVGGIGKFDGSTFVGELIDNFERDRAVEFHAPIKLGVGHPVASAPAAGQILNLKRDGTRLRATVRINGDFVPLIRKGIYKYVSPEFRVPYTDSTGQKRGAKLIALAITNLPFQRGADGRPVGTFHLAELDAPTNPPEASPRAQESTVDEAQVKKAIEDVVGPLVAKLTEMGKTIETLTAKLTESDTKVGALTEKVDAVDKRAPAQAEELAERDAKVATLTEENGALRKGLEARCVKEAVHLAEENGVLIPAQRDKWFPGFDKDPAAAFAASPFKKIKDFIAWCAEAPVIVPPSSRASAPSTPTTDAGGTESPAERAKRLGIAPDRLAALEA